MRIVANTLSCLLILVFQAPLAQAQDSLQSSQLSPEGIRELAADYSDEALALYREFLRFPNDAHFPDDIMAMVEWMEAEFEDLGFTLRRLETPGSPLLLAERDHGAATTVLVYLQSDG
ncbi:MAG: acetylornithine deacetylase, partial [Pseudomonadota bacterium]